MAVMARVNGLEIRVNGKTILRSVDLRIEEGSITLIVGGIGSGKSLLLKSLAGLTQLYGGIEVRGSIEVLGMKPLEALAKGLVAYVPHDPTTFVDVASIVRGLDLSESMRSSASEVLMKCLNSLRSSSAKLVLVEELSSYLDEETLPKAMSLLRELASSGKSVVIADHFGDELSRYVDRVLYLGEGSGLDGIRVSEPAKCGRAVLRDVVASYGSKVVDLSAIDEEIGCGDVIAIVAPNARGKTTLVRALLGAVKLRRGVARVKGPMHVVPQLPPRIFAYPRVLDEAKALGVGVEQLGDSWKALAFRNPYTLSLGESRLLMSLLALASPRKWLVVIDELALGLDRDSIELLSDAIVEASALGKSVLMTTHSKRFARFVRNAKIVELR